MKRSFAYSACAGYSILLTPFLGAQIATDVIDSTERIRRQGEMEALQRGPSEQKREKVYVPEIYEGEFEDIGPQFLLMKAPKRKLFSVSSDIQIYFSNNAGLTETNTGKSDILAMTFQGDVSPYVKKLWGGDLKTRLGYRYQVFRYGVLSGAEDRISGIRVGANDFQSRTPFGEVSYRKGNWDLILGLRYSQLFNQDSGNEFYDEWVPNWSLGYTLNLDESSALTFVFDGGYRITKTDSNGLQADSWNDRLDQSAGIGYFKMLTAKLYTQIGYFGQYSNYTYSSRSRYDFYHVVNASFTYLVNNRLSMRVFGSQELRESDEASTADYENTSLGLGFSGRLKF